MVGTRDARNGTHAWEERPSLSDREVYATSARLKQSQTSVKRFANFNVDIESDLSFGAVGNSFFRAVFDNPGTRNCEL